MAISISYYMGEARKLEARGMSEREMAKELNLTLPTLRRYQAVADLPTPFLEGHLLRRISDGVMIKLTKLSERGQERALAIYRAEGRLIHEDMKALAEGENPAWKRYRNAIKALLRSGVPPSELRAALEVEIDT